MWNYELRRNALIEARSKPLGSAERTYLLRAAFTYGQALRGVPAKDWKFG